VGANRQIEGSAALAGAPKRFALGGLNTPSVAFSVALAGTLIVAFLQGAKVFYYDSAKYWSLGQTFVQHGRFSLLNYADPLRGYSLPLIYGGMHALAQGLHWSDSSAAKLFNALVFALLGGVLLPRLAEIAWPQRRFGLLRRLALVGLLIVFWSGDLNFPLSDFPALAMMLLAVVCVARPTSPGWMMLAGVATGAAIDMRPAYLLLAPIVAGLVVWAWLGDRYGTDVSQGTRRALCAGLMLLGFVAVSLPQSLIYHRHFHTWSFVPGAPANLTSVQLSGGLYVELYETYVGAGIRPRMIYEDEAGAKLLTMQPGEKVTSSRQYLGLIVHHPVTVGGIFIRHAVNGLDQRYSTPYIERLDKGSHRWLRLAGFLLVFLALLRVLWPAARRSLGVTRWRYPFALVLCCLIALPSAVETRFMLPVDVLGYILVLAPGWPNPIDTTRSGMRRFRTLGVVVVAYVGFMAVIWRLVSQTSSHLHFG
jgi:hypothetical protein